jgi:uncharacterized membrane protein
MALPPEMRGVRERARKRVVLNEEEVATMKAVLARLGEVGRLVADPEGIEVAALAKRLGISRTTLYPMLVVLRVPGYRNHHWWLRRNLRPAPTTPAANRAR